MKRKLLATGLLFALLLSTTACGATSDPTGQDTNNDTASVSDMTEADDTSAGDTTEELPQVANLELTEGVVNGNRYENDSFGVAFTLPEGFEEDTADYKTGDFWENDPNYNPDYCLPDFYGFYYFPDTSQSVSVSVSYVELTPGEAVKSTEEIVKDRLEYFNDSDHYTLQEHVIGDQTYYGTLWIDADGELVNAYMQYVYIVRDNKVMKLCVYGAGGVYTHESDGKTTTMTVQANTEVVEQYTQEILNSLELK